MKIEIRPADLEKDRSLIIETLLQYLTPLSDTRRFHWLYIQNPCGKARAWIATEKGGTTVVGVAGAFPRQLIVDGYEQLGWILGDFCIAETHRSLGPALQLQRVCLDELQKEGAAFWYDFPSVEMMAVYRRLQLAPFDHLLRWAKPLRVDRKVKEKIISPPLVRGVSAVGNLLLGFGEGEPRLRHGLAIHLHEGKCGEEFSLLAEECQTLRWTCLWRSAAYLNWRYVSNPLNHYEILTARQDGVLRGYTILTYTSEDALLVDLFGVDDMEVLAALVQTAVMRVREKGAFTVSAPLLESHAWSSLFSRLGFRPREKVPVVIGAQSGTIPGGQTGPGSWLLMYGDRDS